MMAQSSETTVLVIDDEKGVRESYRDYLEDRGYRVLTAADGRTGVDIIAGAAAVDLVLLDLRMPADMDGLDVLAWVTDNRPDLPVVVVSGTGFISDVVAAIRRGAWDYLLKPVKEMSVLRHAVESALEKARLRKERDAYQERLEHAVAQRTEALAAANAHLQQINERLRDSEARLRRIFDTIGTGIIIVSAVDGTIRYANPAAGEMIGQPSAAMVGRPRAEVFCPMPEGGCPVSETVDGAGPAEEVIRTAAGTEIPVLRSVTPLTLEGEACRMESVTDLTALKQAEYEKRHLAVQLRAAQKMEALGTLAGGIAHDFNNLLGAILGYTQLALIELDEPALKSTRTKLDAVVRAGERARDLVSQILAFSRRQEQMHLPVEMAPIVTEAVKLLRSSLPANIRIDTAIADAAGSACVMGDASQLHQVIMNLCTNAYHAMQPAGGTLRLRLDAALLDAADVSRLGSLSPGNHLRLQVSDTGPGIPGKIVDRIFDPYFTTKAKGKGTGLGLSVVHGIIKGHHGAITVACPPDGGTEFTILLPATEAAAEGASSPTHRLPRGDESVLLVDDEADLVDIGREILTWLGYAVTAVSSSREALAVFTRTPEAFDLVVTDLDMPGLRGDELAQEILGMRKDIPVILCTGYSESCDKDDARRIGVCRFLMKPLTLEALARAVREVLDDTLT